MIGKTLYKAKIKDGKVVMESREIVGEKRKYYYFGGIKKCLKTDVGVVCFLTEQKALDYLITKLKRDIRMGEVHIDRMLNLLGEAILFPEVQR